MSLVAWWPLAGNANDISGNNNTLSTNTATLTGVTKQYASFTSGKVMKTGNTVTVGADASVSMWMLNNNNYVTGEQIMAFSFNSASHPGPDLFFRINTMSWNSGDSSDNYFRTDYNVSATFPPTASWVHYTVVCNSRLDKVLLYVNGKYYAWANYKSPAQTNRSFTIGNYYTGTDYAWRGYIRDVRLYDHCLSENEIYGLYSSGEQEGYLPSLKSELQGWYKFDGNLLDSSGNNFHASGSGSYVDGRIGKALSTSDTITTPIGLDTSLRYQKQNYSFSAWFKFDQTAVMSAINTALANSSYNISTGTLLGHSHYGGAGLVWRSQGAAPVLLLSNRGGSSKESAYTHLPFGTWNHYTVTFNNVKKLATLWMDGVEKLTLDYSTQDLSTLPASRTFCVNGAYIYGGNGPATRIPMLVDDVRVYSKALSKKEAIELYKGKMLHYTFDEFQEPTRNLWNGSTGSLGGTLTSLGNGKYKLAGGYRFYADLANLTNNTFYTCSVVVTNINTSNLVVNIDWCDMGQSHTLRPRETRKISVTKNFGTYNSTYRFFDILGAANASMIISDIQIERKDYPTDYVRDIRVGATYDKSGYGYHGVLGLSDAPKWEYDKATNTGYYTFNGTSSGIICPTLTGPLKTISMWVKSSSIPTDSKILFVSPSGAGLGFYQGNRLIGTSSGNSQRMAVLSGYTVNKWNHMVVTYSETMVPTYYMNGVQLSTSTNDNWTLNTQATYIGRRDSGNYFNGQIKDIRVYATALSESDILELYKEKNIVSIDRQGNLFTNKSAKTEHLPLLLDYTQWQNGQSASVGSFTRNGKDTENYRVLGLDPWGKETVLWESRPDSTSDADGGWTSTNIKIDPTKTYRLSTWVFRNKTGNGGFYFGSYTYNSGGSAVGLLNRSSGNSSTNLYSYISTGTPKEGFWELVVFHIHPIGSGIGEHHPDSGVYTLSSNGSARRANTTDAVFDTGAFYLRHRTYLYYCTDTSVYMQWAYPRVDLCDGTEPTLQELLDGHDSKHIDYIRTVGGNNDFYMKVNKNTTYLKRINDRFIVDNKLERYYPLKGNTRDYVSGLHAIPYNVTLREGLNGLSSCYNFNGDTSCIDTNVPLKDFWNGSFTIMMWIKPNTKDRGILFGDYQLEGSLAVNFEVAASRVLRFYWNSTPDIRTGTNVFTYNAWNHIAVIRDKLSSKVLFYVNGALKYTYSGALTDKATGGSGFVLGRDSRTGTTAYSGLMQNVRLYSRALRQDEIAKIYTQEQVQDNNNLLSLGKKGITIRGDFYETL